MPAQNIEFKSQQDPSALSQGEGRADLPDPLGEKAHDRVDRYDKKLAEVIGGERPILSGEGKGDKFLEAQLATMSAEGMLPEESNAYYRKPQQERVLGYNPIPHQYVFDREGIYKRLARAGVNDVRVAGDSHQQLRRQRIPMEKQIDSATMTIAIPGDLYAAKEMVHIVREKLSGRMLDHPLIIENAVNAQNEGYWDGLLRGIKIFEKDQGLGVEENKRRKYVDFDALAHHYGIYVTEDRNSTLELAKKIDPKTKPLEQLNIRKLVPDGSVLFVATGTMKKYHEIEKICRASGMDVRVRPIYELVDTFVGPQEVSRTYEGNVAEKMQSAFTAWNSMGDEHYRAERLKHLGLNKKQVFILAEDSGFHFAEKGIADEDEFRNIRHTINPDAPFPGVETGPATIGADGVKGFMRKMQGIFARRTQKGEAVDHGISSKSVIAIAPLEQQEYGKIDMHMVSGETRGRVTFTPSTSKDGSLEIANYLIPDPIPGLPRDRTEAQLGEDFMLHHSPRAQAMRAQAIEMQFPKNVGRMPINDYSDQFAAGIVVDEGSYASKHQADQLAKVAHQDGFGVITLPSAIEKAADVEKNILSKSDGIIFAFDPKRAKEEFWRNVYLFTSMIVGEQTHDKYKFTKPFYLVNPNGEFKYLEDLVSDFHHQGTVPENPTTLFRSVKTIEEAVEGLKEDRKSYRRYHIPDYARQEKPNEPEGRRGTKSFNVAVFCSASNKNARYTGEARKLAEMLVKEDFGLVSGAGLLSMMGEVTKVGSEHRSSHRAEHLGSNVPHIMPGEGDARDQMTEFLMARNIYERMEYMIDKSDAFAVMVGGTGTVQEMALLALLKKRAIEGNDPYAKKKMDGKEIVIINTQMDTANRGFFDGLKKIIDVNDPEACEKLGIRFVSSVDEAMDRMRQLRAAKTGVEIGSANTKGRGAAAGASASL